MSNEKAGFGPKRNLILEFPSIPPSSDNSMMMPDFPLENHPFSTPSPPPLPEISILLLSTLPTPSSIRPVACEKRLNGSLPDGCKTCHWSLSQFTQVALHHSLGNDWPVMLFTTQVRLGIYWRERAILSSI